MRSRILRFLLCLAAVLAAFWAYALLAVPLIEPTLTVRKSVQGPRSSRRGSDRYATVLSGLFPAGAWELESPKILETDQGLVLFKDYQPSEDGRLEVTPFTVVFHSFENSPGSGKKQRPIVLSTPAGAILEFDRPIDPGRTEFGKLVSGNLRGTIHIHSPESSPGAEDALQITTRDVHLNQNSIKTPYNVSFRIGPHFGKGKDLTIDLSTPAKSGADSGMQTRFGQAKSLQLTHVERIYLYLADEGFFAGRQHDTGQQAHARETVPVEVTCLGPLNYDFDSGLASFEDHVDVIKVNPHGSSDQLNCDRLEVHFSPDDKSAGSPSDADDPTEEQKERMKAHRIIATGNPATLRAPSNSAAAVAQRMEFDLFTKQVILQDAREVQFKHDRDEIRCPQLRYKLGPPGRLGQLGAHGPGTFRRTDASEQTEIFAKWERRFTIVPQGDRHLATLQGDTRIEWPDSVCDADQLRVWIVEVPREQAGNNQKRRFKILPTKLDATGNVNFDTPRLAAETEKIEVLFEQAASTNMRSVQAGGHGSPVGKVGNGRQPSEVANANRGATSERHTAAASTTQQKFHLAGDRIRARVLQTGGESSVREVAVVGDVHLRETIVDNAGDSPIDVTGHSLHLFRDDREQARIQVRAVAAGQPGQQAAPARVSARDLTITAAEVNLDQTSNRLWVDGTGTVTIAARNRMPDTAGNGTGFSENRSNSVITWKDRMVFDGKVVHFQGNVVGSGQRFLDHGQLQTFSTRSRTADLTLTRFVDIGSGSNRRNGAPELAEIQLDGGIVMDSQTYDSARNLAAVDHVEAADLSVNYVTGSLLANGAGYMRSVRRGQQVLADRTASATLDSAPSPDTLTYTRVNFQRSVEGNIFDRRFDFYQGIEAVHGPVAGWQDRLDPNRRDGLGEHGVLITCNQLTAAETGSRSPGQTHTPAELIAVGSAYATGQRFEAHGHRISMDQTKASIVLEGNTREGARIFHQPYPGAPRNRLAAGKIYYSRKTGRVQWQDLTLGEVVQPYPLNR